MRVCVFKGRAVTLAYAQIYNNPEVLGYHRTIRSRLDGSRTEAISCCATRCEWNSIELMLLYHTIPWCNQQNGAVEGRRTQKNQWGLPTNPLCTRLAKVIICGPQITKANRQTKPKRGSQTAISVCVYGRCVTRDADGFPAALVMLVVLPSAPERRLLALVLRDTYLLYWAI